ncbi:MAG: NAD-dependent epimerase/dehydratase family protein, partial [Segetibacter sp.]|nr:NAD-dependent epimerase/dehydratase family protein [Segetibacter sp.]
MSRILITGGSGLIGSELTPQLVAQGHEVIIVSRTPKPSTQKNILYATWDVKAQTIDSNAIAKADYIIHLAGAGVADKRWTE